MFRLEHGTNVIYLPNPKLGDGYKLTDDVILKRTISGNAHTTIRKNSNRKRYEFSFDLVSEKQVQLVNWLKVNGTNLITVVADQYSIVGYINQEQALRSLARWSEDGEKWEFNLEIHEKS